MSGVTKVATIEGLLLIDKPSGMTSMEVDRQVKRVLHADRVGHLGTLDPLATGVLPVFVGRATRLIPYLESGDKEYLTEITFGMETDTWDVDGQITAQTPCTTAQADIEALLPQFVGTLQQVPPAVSAKRFQGKRFYELQRDGQEVPVKPVEITITSVQLVDFSAAESTKTKLHIHCSKGTYIRAIAHELGQKLGCGGTQSQLRRTRTGPFNIERCTPLEQVLEKLEKGELSQTLIPLPDILSFPKVRFEERVRPYLKDGRPLPVSLAASVRAYDPAQLVDEQGILCAVGRMLPGDRFQAERVFI